MEFLGGCFLLFVAVCIMCAFIVGAALFVLGTIVLISKLVIWMAYLGVCFIILWVIGCGLAKLFKR